MEVRRVKTKTREMAGFFVFFFLFYYLQLIGNSREVLSCREAH